MVDDIYANAGILSQVPFEIDEHLREVDRGKIQSYLVGAPQLWSDSFEELDLVLGALRVKLFVVEHLDEEFLDPSIPDHARSWRLASELDEDQKEYLESKAASHLEEAARLLGLEDQTFFTNEFHGAVMSLCEVTEYWFEWPNEGMRAQPFAQLFLKLHLGLDV